MNDACQCEKDRRPALRELHAKENMKNKRIKACKIVLMIAMLLCASMPVPAAERTPAGDTRPFLRPPPSAADTQPPELLSVSLAKQPEPLNAEDKRTFPDGTVKQTVTFMGSGFPQMTHSEYTLVAGTGTNLVMSNGRSVVMLPDGRRFAANGLTCYNPIPGFRMTPGGFNHWGFLEIVLKGDKSPRGTGLLTDSTCVSMTTHTGATWASGDMVFRRILGAGTNITWSLSFKRVVGDPFLYVSVYVPEEETQGLSRVLNLSGYPLSGASVLYGGGVSTDYPGCSSFFGYQRWIWIAGHDWNLHNSAEKHAAEPDPAQPPLVFWYNREANEMSGMMTVFLPAEVGAIEASGTYGVSIALRMKRPVIRLALRNWADWRGWEPAREEFIASSDACVKRLRDISFAWPSPELVDGETRRLIQDALATAAAGATAADLADARTRLEQAVLSYDRVLSEAKAARAKTDLDICRQQQALLLAKGEIEDAFASLRALSLKERK